MNTDEFKQHGKSVLDFVVRYLEGVHERRVSSEVQPMYLKSLVPLEAPENGEKFEDILADIEPKILPGMVHWQHPRFHGYFPSCMSYPSVLGDIVADTIGTIGFSWASGPSCTELEGIVVDWFGKMLGLPPVFYSCTSDSNGGGCIQTSGSECICITIMAARARAVTKMNEEGGNADEAVMLSKLIAYCSKEAHSAVEKGCMIAFTKLRILETDDNFCLRGDVVRKAIEQDRANGLYPFYVCATVGTTASGAVDHLNEIGPICENYDVWLHVDASYAGNAAICEDHRHILEGVENAMSINVNPSKWLLVNFDCACFWVKDQCQLTEALVVEPLYLKHTNQKRAIDYRHWGLPLSRRMRSVKLWMVLRIYGVDGLQKYIQEHIRLAKSFAAMVESSSNFEVMNSVDFGLVTFRLKAENDANQKLLSTVNASGKLLLTPASLNDKYVLRLVVCRENACDADMAYAWDVIRTIGDEIAKSQQAMKERHPFGAGAGCYE